MGGSVSTDSKLAENAHLITMCSGKPVSDNDPLWNQLFSFNFKLDDNNMSVCEWLDQSIAPLLNTFLENASESGNVSSLVRAFLRRANELEESAACENKILLWQAGNALIVLRYTLRFLTEHLSEAECIRFIETRKDFNSEKTECESDDDSEDPLFSSITEEFVYSLSNILVKIPVNDLTLRIHNESVKCLMCLLSTQLYRSAVVSNSNIFAYFLKGECSNMAAPLTKVLLENFLRHSGDARSRKKDPESLVLGIAGSIWSMVSVVAGLDDSADVLESSTDPLPLPSLGGSSIILLLHLACYQPSPASNPFREILSAFQNSQEVSRMPTNVLSFRADYGQLYEKVCSSVEEEPAMLLLYLLLHRNLGFRNYLLSRINLENLVVPVLKVLHEGLAKDYANAHHIYLSVIVMLILSEDDFFCKFIHETTVRGVDWVDPDRPVGEVSLGGLAALVFIKAIHRNTTKMRDRYLHTNCLAALANMSSAFKQLSPTVCQKLLQLLELLTKRHARVVSQMSGSNPIVEECQLSDLHEEISVLEEGMRTVLEILNATLSHQLGKNPHLVYTLLYHKTLFYSNKEHPLFKDFLSNIIKVIEHFSEKIKDVNDGGAAILEAIEKESLHWPTDVLQKFPELKFRYVEDDNTGDFFVPYVWRLSLTHSGIRFDPGRVRLFHPTSTGH